MLIRFVMPSRRQTLTNEHVKDFVRLAKTRLSSQPDEVITDTSCEGLSLLLKRNAVSFQLRYKGKRYVLGYAAPERTDALDACKEARDLVSCIKQQVDANPDDPRKYVGEFLRRYYERRKLNLTTSYSDVLTAMRPDVDTWTLKKCVEQMIDDRINLKIKKKKKLADTTVDEIRRTFKRPEFSDYINRPVVHLKRKDIEKVRNDVEANYGIDPARKVVTWTRSVLKHSFSQHGGLSGLENSEPWWLLMTYENGSEPRTRAPTISDIAKVLILAEHLSKNPLPNSKTKRPVFGGEVFQAFLWIVLTAQRTTAGTRLLCNDVRVADNGWLTVEWGYEIMKGKLEHGLPVPPRVVAAIPALQWRENRKWVFKSYLEFETPVSSSAVSRVVSKLAGIRESKRRHEDLLELNGIDYFSPHDLRRRLVKVLDKANLPVGASAILAHEIKDASPTTQKHYSPLERMDLKKQAISIWTDTILDEVDRLKAEWKPYFSSYEKSVAEEKGMAILG
jgi:hypothetical protein